MKSRATFGVKWPHSTASRTTAHLLITPPTVSCYLESRWRQTRTLQLFDNGIEMRWMGPDRYIMASRDIITKKKHQILFEELMDIRKPFIGCRLRSSRTSLSPSMIKASWSNKSSVIGLFYRTSADSLFAYPVESPWRSTHKGVFNAGQPQ